MDTTKPFNLSELTIEDKRFIFTRCFSSGTNVEGDFGMKFELIALTCFLSQELQKRFPDQFKNTLDVFDHYIFTPQIDKSSGMGTYIIGLSILCDDLMFGCNEIEKPEEYKSALEVKNRIVQIINSWMPF